MVIKFSMPALLRFVQAVLIPVAIVTPGLSGTSCVADHPGLPRTFDLGPNNADIGAIPQENILQSNEQLRHTPDARTMLDLSHRDLRQIRLHLRLDVLYNVSFEGSDLTGAAIRETGFTQCSFRDAKLNRIDIGSEISSNCDLTGADIAGSFIHLTKEQLQSTKNYQQKDLSATTISGDFSGLSFAAFNLRGTMFYMCELSGSDFDGADIRGATVVVRSDRDARVSSWPAVPFAPDQIYATKSYHDGDLAETAFIGCDFRHADFAGQSLGIFEDCDLRGADFSRATFVPGHVHHWYFPFASNRQCGFRKCRLSADQFYSTRVYQARRFPGNFILHDMDLKDWNFSGLDLRGVSFDGSSLRRVDLAGARGGDFRRAQDMSVEQVKSMWNYRDGRLAELEGPAFALPGHILDALAAENETRVE